MSTWPPYDRQYIILTSLGQTQTPGPQSSPVKHHRRLQAERQNGDKLLISSSSAVTESYNTKYAMSSGDSKENGVKSEGWFLHLTAAL
jgi:hypothetical protein